MTFLIIGAFNSPLILYEKYIKSGHLFYVMSTLTRNSHNNQVWIENHEAIEKALKTANTWAGSYHVTVSQLSTRTGLKRDTIYYHLLGDRRPGIPMEKRRKGFLQTNDVKKENGRYIWSTYLEHSKAIKRTLELIASLLEKSPLDSEAENVKGGKIFSENIFIITPYNRRNGTKSFTCMYYPLEELEKFPQIFLSDYLKWIKQVQTTAEKEVELPKSAEDLRGYVQLYCQGTSGKTLSDEEADAITKYILNNKASDEIADKMLKSMSKCFVAAGQIITFRFPRDDGKKYVAGLITE